MVESAHASQEMNRALVTLLEALLRDGAWVPLETYLFHYRGESKASVYTRRSKGIWQDGIHTKLPAGGHLWVNLLAVNQWVALSPLRGSSLNPVLQVGPKRSKS